MTRDQKTISFIIAIVYTFIVLIGSCSHMFKQPYVDPVLKNAFDEWVNQCKLRDINYKREFLEECFSDKNPNWKDGSLKHLVNLAPGNSNKFI